MKKSIGICCALFLACSSAAVLTACQGGKVTEVSFATYETWEDGFYNINMMDGFGRITRSDEQAHGGEYSAKLQPLGSRTDASDPYFYYPMLMEGENGYDYTDFSKMSSVSFYMYNAEDAAVSFDLCVVASVADVYGTDYKAVGNYELAPKTWTKIEYKPDYAKLQDMCDITNVAGIAFVFDNKQSGNIDDAPTLYLDDLKLFVSEEPLAEIKTSTPARGEIQSFDLASSLVYVRMESGLDFAETYLPAGSDKLPAGMKGGVEFTITDAEMGTWPRLHFDSRTSQQDLQGADRISLWLYFGTSDETVKQAELHMFPDTSSEYVEYVNTNEWVKVIVDSSEFFNNYGDSIGVKALGLFWLQNGGSGCFNAIDTIRVADIRAEFDEVRVSEMPAGTVNTAYTIPEALLEVDGASVTAESWNYSVEYLHGDLYKNKFGDIAVTDRVFTPQTGGTFIVTYTATYQGKTYTATAEVEIARSAAGTGEIESFNDPASMDTVRMNSGTGVEYNTPTYLWAGDERLPADAAGGIEYHIDPVYGVQFDGSWPRFYLTSRITANEIAAYDTVSFDIYLDAEGYDKDILLKMYPETDELDKYVTPNKWVTVRLDAQQFAENLSRLTPDSHGFFWVQNGDPVNIIQNIRIANIRAYNLDDVRPAVGATEIEAFGDEYSLDNITVTAASNVRWDSVEKAAVATVDPTADLWMDVSVTARQDISVYRALKDQGYNAVTMEIYLAPSENCTARVAQVNYWAQQGGVTSTQGSLPIGKWTTVTLDLDTYLSLLQSSSSGTVKLMWVSSWKRSETLNATLSEIRVKNVEVAKTTDVIAFTDGAEGSFAIDTDSKHDATYSYVAAGESAIPADLPSEYANGAVKIALNDAGEETYPHLRMAADSNFYQDGNTVTLMIYVKSSTGEKLSVRYWPYVDGNVAYLANGELAVNEWVELKLDAELFSNTNGWSNTDGIAHSDLLWFTNKSGNTVSEIWIAGVRVTDENAAAFASTGIKVEPTSVTTYENAKENRMDAWIGITSPNGYAYELTIKKGETVLVRNEDYIISDQDGSVTLIDPAAGEYSFIFESYGNRFETGTVTVTVAEKAFAVEIGAAQSGMMGAPYTLPTATLTGADASDGVQWACTVTRGDQEYTVSDGKFTPDVAGTYTVTYTANYRGKTFTASKTFEIKSYTVDVAVTAGGTTGTAYTIPTASLMGGAGTITDGVTWSYTVVYEDETVYNAYFDDLAIADMQFTPMMAGTYKVTYTANYDGQPYTLTVDVEIARKAAAEGEIESFDDAASLYTTRLGDYAATYLPEGSESLPADAKGGIFFAFPNEMSWPDLFVTARENASLDGYSDVVLRVYVASGAERIELRQQNGGDVIFAFKANEWVDLRISASEYAAYMTGTSRICFVQNADENNLITELRIAGVYAENASDAQTVLDMNTFGARIEKVWGDAGLNIDSRNYVDASAVPAGMPEGSDYAVEATVDQSADRWGQLYIRPSKTLDALRAMKAEGYNAVTLNFYVQTAADSSCTQTQLAFFPDYDGTATQFAVNKWNSVTLGLDQFIAQMDASGNDDQVFLLWVQALQSDKIDAVYFSGFELTKAADLALLELNAFGDSVFGANKMKEGWSDGALGFDGTHAYLSNALIDATDAPAGRALHISVADGSHDGSFFTKFAAEQGSENPFTALQTDYDTVRILFYIVPADGQTEGQVQFTVNGQNKLVDVGKWVTVDLALSDVAGYCTWNEGSSWWQWQIFYFYDNGTTVTDIYASGFTLLKTQG